MLEVLLFVVKNAAIVAGAMLPIMNPLGSMPIFLTLSRGATDAQRQRLASRIAVNVAIVTFIALLLGSYVLEFFGISTAAVRVGGGILVMVMGWRLLNAESSSTDAEAATAHEWNERMVEQRAFYPLTFPFTVGPGSLSVAVTLGARIWGDTHHKLPDRLLAGLGAIVGVIIVALVVYACFRSARTVLGRLGETGTNVMLRFAAFILLCIGVQIAWEGVAELLQPWRP
ncbi:MAG: MarC family protein [Rhodocyclaceae bacterium]